MSQIPRWTGSHPLRPVDVHWQRAGELLMLNRRASRRHDDPAVHRILAYRRAVARGTTPRRRAAVARRYPDLDAAVTLDAADGLLAWEVRARLAAGESFDTIAAKTALSVATVRAFELARYHVADRVQARDWMLCFALRPQTWERGKPTTAQVWLTMGFFLGPVAVDLLVDAFYERPTDRPDIRDHAVRCAELQVRLFTGDDHPDTIDALVALCDSPRNRLHARVYRIAYESRFGPVGPAKPPKKNCEKSSTTTTSKKKTKNEKKEDRHAHQPEHRDADRR